MALDLNLALPQRDPWTVELAAAKPAVPGDSWDALSDALKATADRWAPAIFPRGVISKDRTELRLADISGRAPRDKGSTVIYLRGEHAGSFKEFDQSRSDGGGPCRTIAQAFGLSGAALAKKIKEILADHGGEAYLAHQAKPSAADDAAKAKRKHDKIATEIAFTLQHSVPIAGTLAEVYLRARGVTRMPTSEDLRFNGNTTHWKTKSGMPAIIATFRLPDGTEAGSIHRIYLKPDGSGHIGQKPDAMPPGKMMLNPVKHAVVMLAPIGTGGVLAIGEGIETGCAVQQLFGVPFWAAGSADGMVGFGEWLLANRDAEVARSIKRLLICCDARKVGEDAGRDLLAMAAELGIPHAELWHPRGGDDFLEDLVKGLPRPDAPIAWLDGGRIVPEPEGGAPLSTQDEITPVPRTQEEVARLIETLIPGLSPVVIGSTTDMAIAGLASLRLDLALAEPFLVEIKRRTGAPIGNLRDLFRGKLAAITGPSAKPAKAGAVEAMLERYIHVKEINSFWDTKARTVLTVNAVCNAHWREMPLTVEEHPEPINPFDFLIKGVDGYDGCRRADRFVFKPGSPEFFEDERGCTALNIWVKPTLEPFPGEPKDVNIGPLMRHAEYILNGDATLIKHQFDYLAHLVQKPWEKLKNTILIIGEEGVGKTVLAEMMVRILGPDNVAFIDSSNLESQFNGYMDGKLLVVVNELVGLDKKAMNRLKAYITDSKMTINRKGIPTYDYESCANFLLYSNYDDAARISEGDRRFCIEKSKARPREPAYYTGFWGWFNGGGDAHVLRFLQDRDLSAFNPYAPPPITKAKLDIIDDSRDHTQAYLQDAFDTGEAPFRHDLVAVSHIVDWLNKERGMRITHMQVTKFLRSIGAVSLGQRSIREKQRAMVWAIRRAPEWDLVGENDLKKAWRDIDEAPLSDALRNELLGCI